MPFELRQHTKRANVFRLHVIGNVRPIPPGMLTYKLEPEELKTIDTLPAQPLESDEAWTHAPVDDALKLRLLPVTQNQAHWTLLFAMKRVDDNATVWLKGALINSKTGKIALLTSANTRAAILNNGNRAIKSHEGTYHVGQYTMLAPLSFWIELKSILSSI
jgi:hypothetical protein